MKAFIRIAVIGALFVVVGYSHASAQLKIGVVVSETIITALPEFKQVQQRIETMQQSYLDTLRSVKAEFDQQFQKFQQQAGTLNAETKAQEEARLTQMQQRLQAYQNYHLGPQGTVIQAQNELLQPIRAKVIEAIEAIAKKQNLDAVMEKVEGGFLYVDPKMDITFKVLDHLQSTGK